jgi:hypothetical protein
MLSLVRRPNNQWTSGTLLSTVPPYLTYTPSLQVRYSHICGFFQTLIFLLPCISSLVVLLLLMQEQQRCNTALAVADQCSFLSLSLLLLPFLFLLRFHHLLVAGGTCVHAYPIARQAAASVRACRASTGMILCRAASHNSSRSSTVVVGVVVGFIISPRRSRREEAV